MSGWQWAAVIVGGWVLASIVTAGVLARAAHVLKSGRDWRDF